MTEHWRTKFDSNGVRWLSLDKRNSSTNVLSRQVLEELSGLLDSLESEAPTGVVIKSTKPTGFILGADLIVAGDKTTFQDTHTYLGYGPYTARAGP